MIQIQLFLGIFFLYLTILGGGVQDLFSCELQRQIQRSLLFKHLLVIISIYFFTFVLGWYTQGALKAVRDQQANESFETQKQKTPNDWLLVHYLIYTIGIYGLFILTTKCEFLYLMIVFVIVLGLLIFYLRRLYRDEEDIEKTRVYETFFEYGALGILLFGFGMYAMRQYADHRADWNVFTFLFGSNSCRSV